MAPRSFANEVHASLEAPNSADSTVNRASDRSSHIDDSLNGTSNGIVHTDGSLNGTSNGSSYINGTSNGSSNAINSSHSCPIAIVGMSCKFAGDATNASKFWDLCVSGKDSWSPIPSYRFNAEALYHPDGLKPGRVGCLFKFSQWETVLSPEGRCFGWDHRASGYGRGEGVATLVLKRLDDALRDGDSVHAVIRESALNQDGKTTTISSPSMAAQQKLIEECYRRAGLDPGETGYVEAHMTGTDTGDPIEAEALARTFGKSRPANDPIIVGSCKPNIGHTEPVSGLAAIIKASYVLQSGLIPPNTNYEKTNPKIPMEKWNLKLATVLTPFPQDKPLRASINNFGYGGTNTHVILESAPNAALSLNGNTADMNGTGHNDGASRIYILSSKDSTVTQESSKRLAAYVQKSIVSSSEPLPADLAYTLAERRSRFPWAVAVKARSLPELADRLSEPKLKATRALRTVPRIGFVFNGQGAQWYAMGRELMAAYPLFGSGIQQADQILTEYGATWSLYKELMRDAKSTRVHSTELSQPVSVALQLCLVDLLSSWGITPSAVTSHSSGEIAAAYAVGALSFKQALGVAYYRGELALKYQKISSTPGGMLAAGLSSEKAEEYLEQITGDCVVVACINSSDSVTLSGDLAALDKVASRLEEDGIFARKLKVPLAYHSHHMMSMAQEYTDRLKSILPDTRNWSGITFTSPVTGGIVTSPKILGPNHWVRNLTSPVLFMQALESMYYSPTALDEASRSSRQGANVDMFIEIGAHSTLEGPIKQILKGRDVVYVSCLKRSVDAIDSMQDVVCELLVRGYSPSLEAVNSPLSQAQHKHVHDLPSYAWNHATRYWSEPRAYKDHRNRQHPPHELLGTRLSGSNRQIPTWRNFLRVNDIPWLTDHQLESTVVLPGAGYIAMAIEAMCLLTDASEKTIRGYRLRDIDIMNALRISDHSAGIETQFSLRPCSDRELDYKGWYEFSLCSVSADDSWIQHCKGYVSAEIAKVAPRAVRSEKIVSHMKSFLDSGVQTEGVNPESVFTEMRKMNIYHGPAFQNLIDIRSAAHKTMTTLNVSTAAQHHNKPYVLHPTTLDSIFQAFYVCIPEETKKDATVVPRSIRSMFVPKDLKRHSGERLRAFTNLLKKERRGATCHAVVVNDDIEDGSPAPTLLVEDFYFQGMSRAEGDESDSNKTRLCAKTQWELDVLHDVPKSLKEGWSINLDDAGVSFMKKWLRVSYRFIYDTVAELQGESQSDWTWYHKLFFTWMESVVELGKTGKLATGSQGWSKTSKGIKQRLIDDLVAENAAGRLTCRVGPKLANIIRGEVTPLELMMEGNLLNEYYQQSPPLKDRSYKHLRQIAELYGVKQPGAKVLEIGAGTGGATMVVLEGLGARAEDGSGTLLDHYDFTDVSSGFFEAARSKFTIWEGMIDFKKFDVESDPVGQSLTPGSYDLIIASFVLHATKSLHTTMTNVRKLLKPGGKLFLLETTQDRVDLHMIFGTLPGWWLSEEPDRKMSPNAPLGTWNEVLKATGFTGIDFEISDCEDLGFQSQSMIVSTAQPQPSYPSSISIIYTQDCPPQTWVDDLTRTLQSETSSNVMVESFESVQVTDDRVYIFIAEITTAFIDGIDSKDFEKLQSLLVKNQGVLWLSCSSTIDAKNPLYAQAQGLMRTMNQEDINKRCILLDFEISVDPWTTDKIPHIVHVLQQSFDYNVDPAGIEREYAVKNSMLHVPRFYQDAAQDRASSESETDPAPEIQPFWQPDRDLVWETGQSGMLDDLHFTQQIRDNDDLPNGTVEIQAKAFGLNFRDVMIALDQLDETLIGHDCSGIVKRLGPDTEHSGLRVGDRVCGIAKGRFASVSRALWTSVARIPDEMSWEEAASLPIAHGTAYVTLMDIARLEKSEKVLIHAATGGVGQAAVMIAQHVGAEVFVTCGTEAKREFLMQKYHIDSDHIFSSRDTSFASAVMAETGGKGIDVVLNSLAGPMLKATWDCIAQFGRFLEIGKMDLEAARCLDLSPFARSATYAGFDILQYIEYKGRVVHHALTNITRLCQEQVIRPANPITLYSISDMEKAMRQMQGGSHIGKLVLVPGTADQVKVISRLRPLSLDDLESTYLIVGGLGGIGRAIALWMIDKGAKNILISSRRGATNPDALLLQQSAQAKGCNLQIRGCDISDEKSLVKLRNECAGLLPPIRGVIQGAMQLDDTVFERMTYDQWQRAILPKVAGTMNLHKNLPNLSFFIMLSSLSGVLGNVSQANYAAGNTFQDALARHRTANGLPAVAIDLGAVTSVGYVAERNTTVLDRVEKNFGSNVVTIDALLRLIEAAIRSPLRRFDESQVVTCIADYDSISEGNLIKTDRRFGTLQLGKSVTVAANTATGGANGGMDEIVQALSKAEGAEAVELANTALVNKLAGLFNIPMTEIDTSLPLPYYGVDSLVAVELRNWLSSAIKAKVTIFEILQGKTMTEFAALVAKRKGILIAPK
ncbi:MAG: hypothetical protein Q9217_003451 [Psora testacea]